MEGSFTFIPTFPPPRFVINKFLSFSPLKVCNGNKWHYWYMNLFAPLFHVTSFRRATESDARMIRQQQQHESFARRGCWLILWRWGFHGNKAALQKSRNQNLIWLLRGGDASDGIHGNPRVFQQKLFTASLASIPIEMLDVTSSSPRS